MAFWCPFTLLLYTAASVLSCPSTLLLYTATSILSCFFFPLLLYIPADYLSIIHNKPYPVQNEKSTDTLVFL
jgi:hypothetical protein